MDRKSAHTVHASRLEHHRLMEESAQLLAAGAEGRHECEQLVRLTREAIEQSRLLIAEADRALGASRVGRAEAAKDYHETID